MYAVVQMNYSVVYIINLEKEKSRNIWVAFRGYSRFKVTGGAKDIFWVQISQNSRFFGGGGERKFFQVFFGVA